jgi:hypothetical protein
MRPTDTSDQPSCSFCLKGEGSVSKLVSSPDPYPKVYICDECIAVCATILKDDIDRLLAHSGRPVPGAERHPLIAHPLASSVLIAVERWITRESVGDNAAQQLAELRSVAAEMIKDRTRGNLSS